jgi:regulator of replication initiation timing
MKIEVKKAGDKFLELIVENNNLRAENEVLRKQLLRTVKLFTIKNTIYYYCDRNLKNNSVVLSEDITQRMLFEEWALINENLNLSEK